MPLKSLSYTIDSISRYLPFQIHDIEAVNRTFAHWHYHGDTESKRIVDLWAYCYSRHYFLVKFMQDSGYTSGDLDQLLETAYTRILENLHTVRQPGNFASWVSVICRRLYINYLRCRKALVRMNFDAMEAPDDFEQCGDDDAGDPMLAYVALRQAIDRLPRYLQEIAALRFLEGLTSVEIGQYLGRPEPTIRAYISKITSHFQNDTELRNFAEGML
jgi:RNA polymerase sigma factor (sigma-70 family)